MWTIIQNLVEKGEFDLAKVDLKKLQGINLTTEEQILKQIMGLKILLGKSKFNLLKKKARNLLKKYHFKNTDLLYYQINNLLIEACWRSNYFDKALKIANKFELDLLNKEELSFQEQYGYLLYNLSRIYLYMGDFKKSQSFGFNSLEIRKKLPSKLDLSESYNVLGIIYGYKGESNKAIEMYEKSLELRKDIGNRNLVAYSLNNIGENYRLKGDIKKALEYYDQCYKICSEKKDIEGMRLGLVGKGTIYMSTGELNKALMYYEECLSLFSNSLSPYHQIEILFLIVRLKLIMKIDYDKELEKINHLGIKFKDKTITFFVKLTNAFIIKENIRIKIKLTAQDLFEEILRDTIVNMEFTILAMESLVELYLIELQISENNSLLTNISQLIENMLKIAINENFYPLMIRTIILQARLALLSDDIGNCLHILESAQKIAEEKDLKDFLPLIEKENGFINVQLSRWQNLIKSDATMYEKIKESQVLNYLQDIRRIFKE